MLRERDVRGRKGRWSARGGSPDLFRPSGDLQVGLDRASSVDYPGLSKTMPYSRRGGIGEMGKERRRKVYYEWVKSMEKILEKI